MSNTGVTPLTPEQEAAAVESAKHEGYLHEVIKGVDDELNVITGGNFDQSMSSRIGLDAAKGDKVAEVLAKGLDMFESDHCVKAEVADEVQAEEVVKLEQTSTDLPDPVQ